MPNALDDTEKTDLPLLEGEIVDYPLLEKVQNLQKASQERAAKQPPAPVQPVVTQLPLWPEPLRGVPNSILRGALFAAVQGKYRQAFKRKLLATQDGFSVRFTGWQLDQADLDVWEQSLHLAKAHPLGTRCDFTAHGFLKSIGRSTGKAQHEWLKDVYARLSGCAVEVSTGRFDYGGSLLEYYRDNDTRLYRLEFNPKLIGLFDDGWTATDWEQRKAIGKKKSLALWLHGFYASHAKPYPMKIETIHNLSGSTNKDLYSFTQHLETAHEVLVSVEALNAFDISRGVVSVERKPTRSQQNHLNKRKSRKN